MILFISIRIRNGSMFRYKIENKNLIGYHLFYTCIEVATLNRLRNYLLINFIVKLKKSNIFFLFYTLQERKLNHPGRYHRTVPRFRKSNLAKKLRTKYHHTVIGICNSTSPSLHTLNLITVFHEELVWPFTVGKTHCLLIRNIIWSSY